MPTLFEIADDLRALADLLAEGDAELADETAAAAEAWFAELGGQEAEKLDAYVDLIRRFESEAQTANEEAQRYDRIASVRGNAAARLKNRLRDYLAATGQPKVQTATGRTVRIQKNGTAPLVVDDGLDLATVPPELVKVSRSIDLAAVRDRLKAGESLPFARLGDPGCHLRIG